MWTWTDIRLGQFADGNGRWRAPIQNQMPNRLIQCKYDCSVPVGHMPEAQHAAGGVKGFGEVHLCGYLPAGL